MGAAAAAGMKTVVVGGTTTPLPLWFWSLVVLLSAQQNWAARNGAGITTWSSQCWPWPLASRLLRQWHLAASGESAVQGHMHMGFGGLWGMWCRLVQAEGAWDKHMNRVGHMRGSLRGGVHKYKGACTNTKGCTQI
jgi:hypothetical protein